MRIIAGTARSLPLKAVEGMGTRPTTDRIKETLFNILQDEVPGSYFLDLFAGSGGIGIEALSSLNISLTYKAVIASCFLAFGGLSVHTQVISIISETKIKYTPFLIGRILQALIASIILSIIAL